MSEYYVPIFTFEGDAYNASLVAGIVRTYNKVRVLLHSADGYEPTAYEFEYEAEAVKKQAQAIKAWQKAAQ